MTKFFNIDIIDNMGCIYSNGVNVPSNTRFYLEIKHVLKADGKYEERVCCPDEHANFWNYPSTLLKHILEASYGTSGSFDERYSWVKHEVQSRS